MEGKSGELEVKSSSVLQLHIDRLRVKHTHTLLVTCSFHSSDLNLCYYLCVCGFKQASKSCVGIYANYKEQVFACVCVGGGLGFERLSMCLMLVPELVVSLWVTFCFITSCSLSKPAVAGQASLN